MDTQLVKYSIMDVYRLMQEEGLSKTKACERLGISWTTFMRWQREHPEIMKEFNDQRVEILKTNLLQLSVAYQTTLNKMLEKAETVTDLSELLSLESRLRDRVAEATAGSGGDSEQQKNAAKFLTGVKPIPGVSKVTRTTETIEFGTEEEIIDGEIKTADG